MQRENFILDCENFPLDDGHPAHSEAIGLRSEVLCLARRDDPVGIKHILKQKFETGGQWMTRIFAWQMLINLGFSSPRFHLWVARGLVRVLVPGESLDAYYGKSATFCITFLALILSLAHFVWSIPVSILKRPGSLQW
jgi:hypothetical protein